MRRFFHIYTLASLCVCAASVSAQEKTPVALTSDNEELATSIATNPFSHNWELSVGLQGLSFFSNQETALDISKSPFASFRTNIGFAVSAAKWFTPQIALRTKLSGAWGRSVSTDDKEGNAVNYIHLHEDVMVNLSNIIFDYEAGRKWNIIPYFGVGMARNFTHNENALTFSLGIMPTYRLTDRLKAFADLSFNITGDEFDDQTVISKNIFQNHDRWLAAEIGVIYELGHNKWHRAVELEGIEVVPWQETQREMKRIRRQNKDLRDKMMWMEDNPQTKEVAAAPTIISKVPEISIFFELGSAELTHRGQLVNIKKLVQIAKEENKNIIVTGYADSQTGNQQFNEKLSAQRADTIVKELLDMGVDTEHIKIVIGGGVDILKQIPANRRVVLTLGD